jgi:hypothetical protein
MRPTVSIEVPADHEQLIRRFLALTEELDHLADTAADGTVFDACENMVLLKGRDMQRSLLQEAVQRRIDAAEKKGRPSESARAGGAKKTAARKPDRC